MRILIVVILFCIVECSIATEYAEGIMSFSSRSYPMESCEPGRNAVCKNCVNMRICALNKEFKCQGTTKYCVHTDIGSSCSSTPDPNVELCRNSGVAQPIPCTSYGYFPDPRDCRIYHYCSPSAPLSVKYTCPQGYVFNEGALTGLQSCKKQNLAADCVTMKCDPASTAYIPYGKLRKYYGFCHTEENVEKIIMFQCPRESYFDGTGCAFKCPREGFFTHPDPSMYYYCYIDAVTNSLTYKIDQCVSGLEFSAEKQDCVPF